MTITFGAKGQAVYYTNKFIEDAGRLPNHIIDKIEQSVRMIQTLGMYQSGVLAEKITGHSDSRFRILRVDLKYRMVGVTDGGDLLLMKVGNHDEAERWGETATFRTYEEKVLAADVELGGRGQRRSEATSALFGPDLTVTEIVTSPVLSDEIALAFDGVLKGWADGTIEDWMIFLSPVQRRAVDRAVGGPARVTGGPGTGKSVVGLHRAASFARELGEDQRLLVTSFVRTVPQVLAGLFERLVPDLAGRVDFASVHSLAGAAIPFQVKVDATNAKRRFKSCLHSNRSRQKLLATGGRLTEEYLWEEVTRVIEGRGLTNRNAYLDLQRHGRKRPIAAAVRELVWDLYEEYRASCNSLDEPIVDWDRLLQLALVQVSLNPRPERYSAIIVDEAQDISEVGVRFLLELLEDGADGRIILIGDAGQRIYPGGYRLAELGLEIRGRSFPMTVCYRSTDEIMQAVGALGQYVSTEEFGEDGVRGLSTATVRSGNRPRLHSFAQVSDEHNWILSQLNPDDEDIDATAILTFSGRLVEQWQARLLAGGLGSVALDEYRGQSVPGVKVGTYHRAKGLEFKRIYLPGLSQSYPFGDRNDPDEMVEKGSLLYVAMSRARDELDISYAGRPSMFLEALLPHVESVGHPPESAELTGAVLRLSPDA